MGFRDEVAVGAHDELLVGRQVVERDPIIDAQEAVVGQMLQGEDVLEAIVSGPYGSTAIATGGSSRLAALAGEGANWMRAGGGSSAAGIFYNRSRDQLIDYLYWLYRHHPIARNIIGHYVNLTIGEGFKIVWKKDAQRERWTKLAKKIRWKRKLRKLIKHTYLLGEWFSVVVPVAKRMKVTNGGLMTEQLGGSSNDRQLRGIGPEDIETIIYRGHPTYDPDNKAAPDVEDVMGYKRTNSDVVLHADDVVHHRTEEISNLPNGFSVLDPVLRYLRLLEKFVEDRYHLNHTRARVPAVRKVMGGRSQTLAIANGTNSLPRPGSVITENGAVEWKFPELNIEARDAVEDGKLLITMCAAGTQLPTYLITSDPANTNYASLMAADSPTIAVFEGLQEDIWVDDISDLISRISGEDDGQFEVVPGAVIKRNVKTIADGFSGLVDRRIMSRQSAAERMDLDWDQELERMEEEEALVQGFRTNAGMHDPDDEPAVPTKKKGGRPQSDDEPGDDGQGSRRPRPSDRG